MALTKDKKSEILARLKDVLVKAKTVVFVHFKGLNVADTTSMRRSLTKEGVSYTVAKKTLMGKALEGSKIEGDFPQMTGEVAWAYGEDPLTPASSVYAFHKKFPDNISILGGIFEGRLMSGEEMLGIASIPSLPVLRGKWVNIINSPIQRLVVSLAEVAKLKT